MKLSQCTIGVLVIETRVPGGAHTAPLRIGHVAGLEMNSTGEVIPLIKFANPYTLEYPLDPNPPIGYHHSNLNLFVG